MSDFPTPTDESTAPDRSTPALPPPLPTANSLGGGAQADGVDPDLTAPPLLISPCASSAEAPPAPAPADPAAAQPSGPSLPPIAPAPPAPVAHPIVFHGRTDQYFRIWIVNSLLTLLTLGFFFPWAKVRKRRYLRGSTELLGHRFDYQANPVRLLIGHVIVLTLLLGYSVFGVVYPIVRFSVIAVALVLLPWIVVRSLTFNAHNTIYRGLRFRFGTSLTAAAQVYLLEPLLIPLTLGFYYPAWQRSKRGYTVSNHRFGDAYFRFDAPAGGFYSTYLLAGLLVGSALFTGALIMGLLIRRHPGVQPTVMQLLPFFVVYGFGFYVSRQLVYARLFNHVWNHTQLDAHRFRATLNTWKWLGLQLGNLGAIIGSLGLLYPWAAIRAQRYAASCLTFLPSGSIDTIQRVGSTAGSATGDMAAEFIGIDFGL